MSVQLPLDLAPRITAAAVQLVKVSRAGLDDDALTRLVNATVVELWREAGQDQGLGMAVWRELSLAQARIGAHLADGWDAATENTPATAYLAELGVLAGRGTE